jgi:N4-gp56 family major capsid protein
MALGTNNTTTTVAAKFIPEIWSDEVIAGYKKNLVLANLVTNMKHTGKKGDSIHIPAPARGSANAKAASTQVTLNAPSHSEVVVSINKHYEYSTLIEDIAEVQALSSLRRFYTDDAGYALATRVDTDLFGLVSALNGGTQLGGDGGSSAADITDAGIRKMILTLDNNDVPMDNRSLVIPPVAANDLLGINRFTEQQYIGNGDAIKTGKIGQIYGVDVYVSSNCPTSSTNRVGVMLHKDALVLAEQMGVRSQTQYKQEWLGDLFTADTIYGVKELRDNAGVSILVPST